ncbi:MAG: RidA family protein [Acidobacteria bacterium]|nr:RidA family protein [Acidobacteriota bacterium]
MRIFLLLLMVTTFLTAADKKVVVPKDAKPSRNFSPGILSGGTLYVSGQTGADKTGAYPEKFEDEVKQTLANVEEILKAGGCTFADAVAVQVYLTDMEMFARMNTVYTSIIPEPRPTRTTVGVAKLVGKARIEITVTARK